jgi:hypothetical protein
MTDDTEKLVPADPSHLLADLCWALTRGSAVGPGASGRNYGKGRLGTHRRASEKRGLCHHAEAPPSAEVIR